MKFRFLALLFIFTLGNVIWSCHEEDFIDDCPSVLPHFKILSVNSLNMKQSGANSMGELEINEEVDWERFFIRFSYETEYLAHRHSGPNGTLMALSCAPNGWKGDKVGVDTLYVRTLQDYSQDYAAGDVINPSIQIYNRATSGDLYSLSEYIQENKEGVKMSFFDVKLTEAPEVAGTYEFELTYVLNNGEEFTQQAASVNLR